MTIRVHCAMLEKRLGNYSFWLAEDVHKTCNDGWHFPPKYPKLDQQVMEWFSRQRQQGSIYIVIWNLRWVSSVCWKVETKGFYISFSIQKWCDLKQKWCMAHEWCNLEELWFSVTCIEYDSWINHTAENHQITGIATDFNMDILLPGGGGGG